MLLFLRTTVLTVLLGLLAIAAGRAQQITAITYTLNGVPQTTLCAGKTYTASVITTPLPLAQQVSVIRFAGSTNTGVNFQAAAVNVPAGATSFGFTFLLDSVNYLPTGLYLASFPNNTFTYLPAGNAIQVYNVHGDVNLTRTNGGNTVVYYQYGNNGGEDFSGNNYDATLAGTPSPAASEPDYTGRAAGATTLSGNNYYTTTLSQGVVNQLANTSFAASVRIKYTATSNGFVPIFANSDAASYGFFSLELYAPTGSIQAFYRGTGYNVANLTIPPNTFHHFVISAKNDTLSVFFNGKRVIYDKKPASPTWVANPVIEVGRHTPSNIEYLQGAADEFILFNKALTPIEVQYLQTGNIAQATSPACEGRPLLITAMEVNNATYSWLKPNGQIVTTRQFNIPAATLADNGTYTLTVTPPAPGCPAVYKASVQVYPVPVAVPVKPRDSICNNTNNYSLQVQFNANAARYVWYEDMNTNTPASSSSGTTYIRTQTITRSDTFYVAIEGVGGCIGPRVPVILDFFNTNTQPNVNIQQNPVCGSATTLVTAQHSGTINNQYGFRWSNGFVGVAQQLGPGTYWVQSDFGGKCTPARRTFTVNARPMPNYAQLVYPDYVELCNIPGTVNLKITAPQPNVNYMLVRKNAPNIIVSGPIVIGNPPAPDFTFTNVAVTSAADTFLIKGVLTNDNTCSTYAPRPIVVRKVSYFGGPDVESCGCTDVVHFGEFMDVINFNYDWSPKAGGLGIAGDRYNFKACNGDTATYTYVLTKTSKTDPSCIARDTVRAGAFIAANNSAGKDTTVCAGTPVTIGTPGKPGYRYQWVNPPNIADTAKPVITVTPAVTTSYIRKVTNASGSCSVTDTVKVTVGGTVTVNAGTDFDACYCTPVTFAEVIDPAYTYAWQPANGKITVQGNRFVYEGCIKEDTVKQYTLTKSRGGCSGTDVVKINLISTLDSAAGPDFGDICPGTLVTIGAPSTPGYTYRWLNAPELNDSTAAQASFVAQNSGDFIMTRIYTRIVTYKGCTASDIVKVTVLPAARVIKTHNDSLLCAGNLAGRMYSVLPIQGAVYDWSVTGGTIVSGGGTESITVNWDGSPTKVLSLTVNNLGSSCSATEQFIVKYDNRQPDMQLATVNDAKGINLKFAILGTGAATGNAILERRQIIPSTGAWVTAASLNKLDSTYTDTDVNTDASAYQYRVALQNACGETVLSSVHNSMLLKATVQGNNVNLSWNSYTAWIGQAGPSASYQLEGRKQNESVYKAIGSTLPDTTTQTMQEGLGQCFRIVASYPFSAAKSYSNVVCLMYDAELVIYNVLTPNGDNLNDTWQITNIGMYPDAAVKVFNRYGMEVYSNSAYNNTWNGNNVPAGVYFYSLLVNGQMKNGTITVIK